MKIAMRTSFLDQHELEIAAAAAAQQADDAQREQEEEPNREDQRERDRDGPCCAADLLFLFAQLLVRCDAEGSDADAH